MNTPTLHQRLKITLGFLGVTAILCAIHAALVWRIGDYEFLLWNLLLAAVPAFVIFAMPKHLKQRGRRRAVVLTIVFALVWIVFLPNTFYLISEFMHLSPQVLVNMPGNMSAGTVDYGRGDVLYIFDSLLLMISVIFGGLAGGVALFDGYGWLQEHSISRRLARLLIGAVMAIIPIGVYIGRYGRWNSWDLVIQPAHVVTDTLHQFSKVDGLRQFFLLFLTVVIFEILSLFALRLLCSTKSKI